MATVNTEKHSVTDLARQVLRAMGESGVPLTPDNYHVWYVYAEGSNAELTAAVDVIRKSGQAFTDDVNDRLYRDHIENRAAAELLMQAQKQTKVILRTIFEEILSNSNMTCEYGDKLRAYADQLNDLSDLSEIQAIVSDLIRDTTAMAANSTEFKTKLDSMAQDAERLRTKLAEAEREAMTDPLTGLPNRKAFDEFLEELQSDFDRNGALFSVIMLDIDHFKTFNDTYGHKVGDEVLQMLSAVLKRSLKPAEFAARLGGEEFVVLLPSTPLDIACLLAEQIRRTMGEQRLILARTGEAVRKVTLSLGVSVVRHRDTVESVVERADQALYFAKNSGRNQVKAERPPRTSGRRAGTAS